MVLIGRVVSTHGVKGMLKIKPFTDFLERFAPNEKICLYSISNKKLFLIKKSFEKNGFVYVKLDSIDNLNNAKKYLNYDVVIDELDLRKLDKDAYYIHGIIGLKVYDENDNFCGEIVDVYKLRTNDVFEVMTNEMKKVLIPAVNDFIEETNIDRGYLKLRNSEGLFD